MLAAGMPIGRSNSSPLSSLAPGPRGVGHVALYTAGRSILIKELAAEGVRPEGPAHGSRVVKRRRRFEPTADSTLQALHRA
jgi:hypothetical protein